MMGMLHWHDALDYGNIERNISLVLVWISYRDIAQEKKL